MLSTLRRMLNRLAEDFFIIGGAIAFFATSLIIVALEYRTPAAAAAIAFGGGLLLTLIWIGSLLESIRDALCALREGRR